MEYGTVRKTKRGSERYAKTFFKGSNAMTTYCVKGTWIETHLCDCEFCDRLGIYHYVDMVVKAPDASVASAKALYREGLDTRYGKWKNETIKCLGEDEVMRLRGEPELPGL